MAYAGSSARRAKSRQFPQSNVGRCDLHPSAASCRHRCLLPEVPELTFQQTNLRAWHENPGRNAEPRSPP
jgi:hypothetical protein